MTPLRGVVRSRDLLVKFRTHVKLLIEPVKLDTSFFSLIERPLKVL